MASTNHSTLGEIMSGPAKNIILCADGTGNRGGETPDTNVYRMYHAVDIHSPTRKREQITFYDNGVGTSTNKYWKSFTGALGFGFGRNVSDLYEFLAKNYNDGDIIYLFGFSRGAATVRAFAGMLQACGLVDRNHDACLKDGKFNYDKFVKLIDEAFDHYKHSRGEQFKSNPYVIDKVRIKFLGIWDTVPSLGFPDHKTRDPWLEQMLERPLIVWLLRALDRGLNFGPLAHRFYDYDAHDVVDHIYHAIAIDDERKTFLPLVCDETKGGANITQVWFTGMHSDVGGSYNQTGLAYVTMEWMMERAGHHGLDFVDGALQEATDKSNAHGKLHDSREGFGIFFRYAPRNIEDLCLADDGKGDRKINGPVKIHQSTIDRMDYATNRYAPGLLPLKFEIVHTPIADKNSELVAYGLTSSPVDPHVVDTASTIVPDGNGTSTWATDRKKVKSAVQNRRRLYRVFADFSLLIAIVFFSLWVMSNEPSASFTAKYEEFQHSDTNSFYIHTVDIIEYVLPEMFDPFIHEVLIERPIIFGLLLIAFGILGLFRIRFERATKNISVALREKIKRVRNPPPEEPEVDAASAQAQDEKEPEDKTQS